MTDFPTALDSFTNPSRWDNADTSGVAHADQHGDANDAIAALQAKVGIDGSADPDSHDYKIATLDGGLADLEGELPQLSDSDRVFSSRLPMLGTGLVLTSGHAYFVYLGRMLRDATPKYVEFYMTAIGSGAQTAEVGFFSSPSAPNKAGQTLTKIESTGTVDSLTAGANSVKRNTSAFATLVPAGTHLWAGIRTAMATTQPTIAGLFMDFSQGRVLSDATGGAGALTGAGPWTGGVIALPSYATTAICPELRGVLD